MKKPIQVAARLRAGAHLVSLEHVQKTLGLNRASREVYLNQMLSGTNGESKATEVKPDDSMLVLGDVTINQSQTESQKEPAPVQQPATKGMGTLGKLLGGAALIATGAGGVAGWPLIVSGVKSFFDKPAAVVPVTPAAGDPDTDTYIVPEIVDPD